MIFIRTEKITDDKHKIAMHHPDPSKLTDKQKKGGYLVDSLPVKEQKLGKSAVRYYNPNTKEVYVEYNDRPLSQEEMETEEAKEIFKEEGRKEIRKLVQEAADMDELSGNARQKLEKEGVLKKS